MIQLLHDEPAFSDDFITYVLARDRGSHRRRPSWITSSIRVRGVLRTLLLLARYSQEDKPQHVLPKLSQEMLAEMIGTTRSRVSFS